jgi:squalene-associated FAD-dependent desaturase
VEDGARGVTREAAAGNRTVDAVAVVGGGWAGCAAAVTLAEAGRRVVLFEQAATLGGRARRVTVDGLDLDNGQHMLIGAYRQTLGLLRTVHGTTWAESLFARLPLTLAPFGAAAGRGRVALRARRLPEPLHLAAGIALARGLSWRDRLALAAGFHRLARTGFRCPPDQTVAACFADMPPAVIADVWSPLCLAALNTPPARASAQVFANVLREAFASGAAASEFLVPAVDLSALFPDAAARHLVGRGGELRLRTSVRAVRGDGSGVSISTDRGVERFAAAVVAVGPHQLAATLGCGSEVLAWSPVLASVAAFDYESITTAYLAYPTAVALPAPIARLDDAPGHWVFDRSPALAPGALGDARALLAVVISAGGAHDALPRAELVARVDAQLRRLEPALPKPTWSRVIAERRATYACVPRLARPAAGRVAPRIHLAGDYTMADLPPTLEAATRSGVAAAQGLLRLD